MESIRRQMKADELHVEDLLCRTTFPATGTLRLLEIIIIGLTGHIYIPNDNVTNTNMKIMCE